VLADKSVEAEEAGEAKTRVKVPAAKGKKIRAKIFNMRKHRKRSVTRAGQRITKRITIKITRTSAKPSNTSGSATTDFPPPHRIRNRIGANKNASRGDWR